MRNLHLQSLIEKTVRTGFVREYTVGELTSALMEVIENQIEEETPLCPKRCPITTPVTEREKLMSNALWQKGLEQRRNQLNLDVPKRKKGK
jgi:hypothetical protein